MRAGDADEVGRLAHRLRGGAANVGLARLAGSCESIELRAAVGELPSASTVSDLEDEVSAGATELEAFAREMVRDAAAATRSVVAPGPGPREV